MKLLRLSSIICLSSIGLEHVRATTILLDDFSSGIFSLASGGTTANAGVFVNPLTDRRTVSGVGLDTTSWAITLMPEELAYTAGQQLPLSKRSSLTLIYSKSVGTFSILGYEAFAIDLLDVVGTGELIVSVSGSRGRDSVVPISGSGTVLSPLALLDTRQSLDSISAISFRFIAVSKDFSMTVDNVRIVPEPSSAFLFIVSAAVPALLRRRKR